MHVGSMSWCRQYLQAGTYGTSWKDDTLPCVGLQWPTDRFNLQFYKLVAFLCVENLLLINALKPNRKLMFHLLQRSLTLHFVFMRFVELSI
jgi:hypothetical protein